MGPFAIPLGVKGKKQPKPITIYANDLNPSSFEYLKNNKTLNKIKDNFNCYNLDGSEFIKTIVRKELIDGMVHFSLNYNLEAVINILIFDYRSKRGTSTYFNEFACNSNDISAKF